MNKPRFVISCPYDTYSGYGARARDIVKAIIESDKYKVPSYCIRIGTIEQLCTKDCWNNGDVFPKKDSNLFLHLKGRMLVKTRSIWSVIKQRTDYSVYVHQLSCNYFVKN